MHRQAEGFDQASDWLKDMIAKMPHFNTSYFEMDFTGSRTLYRPAPNKDVDGNGPERGIIGPAKDNIVLTDLARGQFTDIKNVFEATYAVQDSVRRLQWRVSSETRTIAGFECHKAVARICDSVYVVAFYTDEIVTSGGPETFNGLPGMILGLAIPRLYTTWFATKVELAEPSDKDFAITSRVKKMTLKDLQANLERSLKNWGKMGQRNTWWVML